jgi:hypothetical protein
MSLQVQDILKYANRMQRELKGGAFMPYLKNFGVEQYSEILNRFAEAIDQILIDSIKLETLSNALREELQNSLKQAYETSRGIQISELQLIESRLFPLENFVDVFTKVQLFYQIPYARKLTEEAALLKEEAIANSDFIRLKRTEAEMDLSELRNANLINDLQKLVKSNQIKSLFWLGVSLGTVVVGLLTIIHPIWNDVVSYLNLEDTDYKASLVSVLLSAPKVIIYIFLIYLFLGFYRKYDSLELAYSHKRAVASSIQFYSDYLFSNVNRLSDHERDKVRAKIISFEIRSLDEVFKVPSTQEKSSQMQLELGKDKAAVLLP